MMVFGMSFIAWYLLVFIHSIVLWIMHHCVMALCIYEFSLSYDGGFQNVIYNISYGISCYSYTVYYYGPHTMYPLEISCSYLYQSYLPRAANTESVWPKMCALYCPTLVQSTVIGLVVSYSITLHASNYCRSY